MDETHEDQGAEVLPARKDAPDLQVVSMPRIKLKGGVLSCNGRKMNLREFSGLAQLFGLFYDAAEFTVRADEIVEKSHPMLHKLEISERTRTLILERIRKKIDRARLLMNEFFGQVTSDHVSWFPYDKGKKSWTLFKIPTETLEGCLNDHGVCILIPEAIARTLSIAGQLKGGGDQDGQG